MRIFKEFVTFSEGNSRGSTKLFGHMSTLLAEQHNHENVEVGQQHSFRDVHPGALVKLFIVWPLEHGGHHWCLDRSCPLLSAVTPVILSYPPLLLLSHWWSLFPSMWAGSGHLHLYWTCTSHHPISWLLFIDRFLKLVSREGGKEPRERGVRKATG